MSRILVTGASRGVGRALDDPPLRALDAAGVQKRDPERAHGMAVQGLDW